MMAGVTKIVFLSDPLYLANSACFHTYAHFVYLFAHFGAEKKFWSVFPN